MEKKTVYVVGSEVVADVISARGLPVTVWEGPWGSLKLEKKKGTSFIIVAAPKEVPLIFSLIKGREDVQILCPVKVKTPWWSKVTEVSVPFFSQGKGYLIAFDPDSDITNFLVGF